MAARSKFHCKYRYDYHSQWQASWQVLSVPTKHPRVQLAQEVAALAKLHFT